MLDNFIFIEVNGALSEPMDLVHTAVNTTLPTQQDSLFCCHYLYKVAVSCQLCSDTNSFLPTVLHTSKLINNDQMLTFIFLIDANS
jgi:hypothetical protein